MADVNEQTIEEVFTWDPPSDQQLVVLGLEEMKGPDRPAVYRILERWKRK